MSNPRECTRGMRRKTGRLVRPALMALIALSLSGCSSLGGNAAGDGAAIELAGEALDASTRKVSHTFEDPQVVIAWRRAEDARAVGNFALAFRHLRSALEIAPDDRALWSRLGEVALRLEQWDAAEKYAMRSNELKPVPPLLSYRNWLIIVQSREQMRDYDGAEQAKLQARLYRPDI